MGEQRAPLEYALDTFSSTARLDDVRLDHQKAISDFFLNIAEDDVGPDWGDRALDRTPLGRALLDHRLQSAIHFARIRNGSGLSAQLRNSSECSKLVRPLLQGTIGLCEANNVDTAPRLGDAPAYLVGTPSVMYPAESNSQLTEAAIVSVATSGFGSLLDSVGLVVLVHERELFGISNSWTTTALPSTIYSDYVMNPIAFGAELAHEAAHLWLNDALAATGNIRRSRATFASPWKGEPRKPFGFLHAVFAFSIVANYLGWAIAETQLNVECQRYLRALKVRETERLVGAQSDLSRVLTLINSDLADIVADVYRAAVRHAKVAA